jgi:hypothetical protein
MTKATNMIIDTRRSNAKRKRKIKMLSAAMVALALLCSCMASLVSRQLTLVVTVTAATRRRASQLHVGDSYDLPLQDHRNIPAKEEPEHSEKPAVVSPNYMLQHAYELEQQADTMEKKRSRALQAYAERRTKTTTTRIPDHNLHFFTYANDFLNLTRARIVLQANRSNFFDTVTALGPEHLPPDYTRQYSDILSQRTGGGYYLWRFPIFEHILETVPEYDYFLFLDAGCTILSTGVDELVDWLQALEKSSTLSLQQSGDEGQSYDWKQSIDKEIMRFPEKSMWEKELRFSSDAVFNAFNISVTDRGKVTSWNGTNTPQLFGGLWLVRNGPQIRRLLAFIYRTMAPDPSIITNEHSPATKVARAPRFSENRHDQSISSIASKLMGSHILAPRMPDWKNPPFLTTRIRKIRPWNCLTMFSRRCGMSTFHRRDMDEYCDEFALTAFRLPANKSEILAK